MNDVQQKIADLREQGWTIQAIADGLDVHRESIRDWINGRYYPAHAKLVLIGLDALLERQPPKKRRYPEGHYLQRQKASE